MLGKNVAKVITIRVPEEVSEADVVRWIAEGLSRRLIKKFVLKYLEEGINTDLERALREFEETRSEVWRSLEEEYKKEKLL